MKRATGPQTVSPPAASALSQDVLRHRRRHWLRVHYTAEFDLAGEINDLPAPLAMREDIDTLTDAVHEVLSVVVGMLAESRHLAGEARARTTKAIADLAQRPREPQITDTQITTGTWATKLVAHVAPYTGDFAVFLGRALPPRHLDLKGPSASERLEAALRSLDTAAVAAQRRIPRVAARQELGTIAEANAAARARRDDQRARAALARLGAGR